MGFLLQDDLSNVNSLLDAITKVKLQEVFSRTFGCLNFLRRFVPKAVKKRLCAESFEPIQYLSTNSHIPTNLLTFIKLSLSCYQKLFKLNVLCG